MNWYSIQSNKSADGTEADVFIFEEIGFWGVTAADFIKEVQSLKVNRINLHINSPGGSITDGMAIITFMRSTSAKVVAYIDGIAASMAGVIAVAANETVMAENAFLHIHAPLIAGYVQAGADELDDMAAGLRKMQESIAGIYEKKSGKSLEEINGWMSGETIMTASEALENGLVNSVSETVRMVAKFDTERHPHLNKFLARQPDGHEENNTLNDKNMTQDEHDKIVANLKAEHAAEVAKLTEAETQTRQELNDLQVSHKELASENTELTRKLGISSYSAKYGVDATAALADENVTLEAFKDSVMEELSKRPTSKPIAQGTQKPDGELDLKTIEGLSAAIAAETDSMKKGKLLKQLKALKAENAQ